MLYFFGDSWTAEVGELETWHRLNRIAPVEPLSSFPNMVSDSLNIPYKNFARPGSSQMSMIPCLINSGVANGDHAIFCLTTNARRFFYKDFDSIVDLRMEENKEALNEYQDSWMTALTCFTLYNYCQNKGINSWFVNVFEVSYHNRVSQHHPLWKEIPDSVWLLPKNTCLVHTEFDAEYYTLGNTNLSANLYDWLNTNNANVQEYIRPCGDHPNLAGRKKIAQRIVSELQNKIKEL